MKTAKKLVAVSLDEMQDKLLGKRGTPERETFEASVTAGLIGRTIRDLRKRRGLTQAALGELVGVKRSNISKLENSGETMSLETVVRLVNALGGTLTINIKG